MCTTNKRPPQDKKALKKCPFAAPSGVGGCAFGYPLVRSPGGPGGPGVVRNNPNSCERDNNRTTIDQRPRLFWKTKLFSHESNEMSRLPCTPHSWSWQSSQLPSPAPLCRLRANRLRYPPPRHLGHIYQKHFTYSEGKFCCLALPPPMRLLSPPPSTGYSSPNHCPTTAPQALLHNPPWSARTCTHGTALTPNRLGSAFNLLQTKKIRKN